MNGRRSKSEAKANPAAIAASRHFRIAASQSDERPEEELEPQSDADREAGEREPLARAPRDREEKTEDERQVGRAHLVDHRRPEERGAVDTPVAHADDPQCRHERDEAEDCCRKVGRG